MEGDVGYIQDRPSSSDKKELDKYDAWASNTGLSRTQAKRQYIETLIRTMHEYASSTPEARELVDELEFVWDQVRNNSNPASGGSDASSPLRVVHEQRTGYPDMVTSSAAAFANDEEVASRPLQVLSPVSQGDEEEMHGQEEEEEQEEEHDGEEEFVDAPISQFDDTEDLDAQDEADDPPPRRPRTTSNPQDSRWRKRVESALVKMTTEVAALREQLESRSYVASQRRHSLLGWLLRGTWFLVKLVAVDIFLLWLVILYLRRKKDRRLEGAVRVLLGDAVAQMQKVGRDIKPKLTGKKA